MIINRLNRNKRFKFFYMGCLVLNLIVCRMSVANEQQTAETSVITPRIIGGTLADSDAWPFMTALVLKDIPPLFGQFCGGTLIDAEWVLTAAHCVFDLTTEDLDVLVGQNQLSGEGGELISITEIIIHNNYNPLTFDSDIALLKLSTPSTFAPLRTLGKFSVQDKKEGALITVIGWGNTSATARFFPDYLHQVDVPIVLNENCNDDIGGITGNMLCAGFPEGGKDSCQGDSGGPAFLLDPESQTLRQVGITSFGVGCALPDYEGVYTRVSEFAHFISSTICSEDDIPGTPVLDITLDGRQVTASWDATENAVGYRLNYAPYPDFSPIKSMDVNQNTSYSITLPEGAAYYVAINAYNFNCRSAYSTIESFIVP